MQISGIMLSPYVVRVVMACRYKGLDFDMNRVFGDGLTSPEFMALNPMGKIPVLVDGEVTLPESVAICEYLDARYPQNPLFPADPVRAAKVRVLAAFADQYILAPVLALAPHMSRRSRDEAFVETKMAELTRGLTAADRLVSPGPYAAGSGATFADCVFLPTLVFLFRILEPFGVEAPLADHGNLSAYWRALQKDGVAHAAASEMHDEFEAYVARMKAEAAKG